MKDNIFQTWDTLCKIHILTKHYTLLAEEYNIETKAFLQPMKEQKDAYEHIIRAYTRKCENKNLASEDEEYMIRNLEKAIGHEYRAYFDTIDYLTLIIRELINKEIEKFSYEEIIGVYPEYNDCKKTLIEIPEKIAQYREMKDIGSNKMLQYASNYGKIVDDLIDCYKKISCNVVQEIVKNKK